MNTLTFNEACARQGIEIDPIIAKEIKGYKSDTTGEYPSVHAPSEALMGLAMAWRVLNKQPQRRLLPDTTIDTDDPAIADRFTHTAYASALNSTVEPVAAADLPVFERPTEPTRAATCPEAEICLARTFRSMAIRRPDKAISADIVVDASNEPIMVRKYLGVRTAITLTDISVGAQRVPAGAIVSAKKPGDERRLYQGLDEKPYIRGLTVTRQDEIATVSPVRLSAYALPRAQRQEALGEMAHLTMEDLILRLTPITDTVVAGRVELRQLRSIAQKAADQIQGI